MSEPAARALLMAQLAMVGLVYLGLPAVPIIAARAAAHGATLRRIMAELFLSGQADAEVTPLLQSAAARAAIAVQAAQFRRLPERAAAAAQGAKAHLTKQVHPYVTAAAAAAAA